MSPDITFHQALFGYDSGHHLLASSLSLSADVKHFLAVATDLSGSAPQMGFETSYTGMPLPGTKYYVLFCTWQALEMPRPGSVWSQVFFIELGDLAQLKDLGSLRTLFCRPSEHNFEMYRRSVTVLSQMGDEAVWSKESIFQAASAMEALYETPERSIVILDSNEREGERIVFSLWSQQWPKLRRNFRFSTGSFSDRGRGRLPFDLQVAPISSRRLWQREGEYLVLEWVNESIPPDMRIKGGDWIQPALDDLLMPGRTDFRMFLSSYGSDIDRPRSAFSKLARAYKILSTGSEGDWTRTLELVGELFPQPTEAISLKEEVCNVSATSPSTLTIDRALSTATFLLTSSKASPFENLSIDLSGLAKELWLYKKNEVLDLLAHLVRRSERPMATSFAAAIAEAVAQNEIQFIVAQRPELLTLILGQNPNLAFSEDLWKASPEMQWRAFEVLDSLPLSAHWWSDLIGAMRPSTTAITARTLVKKAEPFAINGVFKWTPVERGDEWIPTEQWRDALSGPAADLFQTSNSLAPIQLALCAWLVPPQIARKGLSSSRQDVQQLARQPLDTLPGWLRSHTAFLLTTLGLAATDDFGVVCLTRSFFQVHEELASGHYSGESWLLLAPSLPHLGLWKEWDRCKKLRKAVKQLSPEYAKHVASALLRSANSAEQEKLAQKLFP